MDLYGNKLELKNSYLKYLIISIVIHIIIFLSYNLYLNNDMLLQHSKYSITDAIAANLVSQHIFDSNKDIKQPNTNQSNSSSAVPKSHKYVARDSKSENQFDMGSEDSNPRILNKSDKLSKNNNINDSNSLQSENSKIDYYHKSISYEELLAFSENNVNQTPHYPLIAKMNKWQGEVIIVVKLNEKGYVEEAFVKKSSGYEVLDNSALKSIKNWVIDNKYAQKLTIEIPVIFKLIK